MNKIDCNGWVLCPSRRLPGKFYFFNVHSGEAVWSGELEARTPRNNDIQHADKWHNYPEPDCPPEDHSNLWSNKKPTTMYRQGPTFGQAAFSKPPMANFGQNMRMGLNIGPSPPSMPFGANEPIWPTQASKNSDWQRNVEPNVPFWSPEIDADLPKRMVFDNQRYRESSNKDLTKHWVQQQSFYSKRQMFDQKQICGPSFQSPVFGPNRDSNRRISHWNDWRTEPEMDNDDMSQINQFGTLNIVDDFDVQYMSPRRENIFANKTNFGKNPNHYNVPKFNSFPNLDTDPSRSMDNLANYKNTVTPKKHDLSFGQSKTFGKLDLESSFGQKTPSKLNERVFPPKATNFTGEKRMQITANNPSFSPQAPKITRTIEIVPPTRATKQSLPPNVRSFSEVGEKRTPIRTNNHSFSETDPNFTETSHRKSPIVATKQLFSPRAPNFTESSQRKTPMKAHDSGDTIQKTTKVTRQLFIPTNESTEVYNLPNKEIVQSAKSPRSSTEVKEKISSPRKRHRSESDEVHTDLDGATDLRQLLIAKRRRISIEKTTDAENIGKRTDGTKIKTHYTEENKPRDSKKRVTFNLEVDDDGQGEDITKDPGNCEEMAATGEQLTIATLRNLDGVHNNQWYIVADTETLLDEDQFVERLVTTDDKCLLLVPFAVKYEIDALCMGDCNGRPRVIAARQMSRKLTSPPPHIIVQNVSDETLEFSNPILECCLQTMEEGYHVVLITNSTDLHQNAIENDIFSYKLQEIKDGVIAEPEVCFEVPKTQKEIKDKKQENLVSKVPNDYKHSASGNKDQIPFNRAEVNFEASKTQKDIREKTPVNIVMKVTNDYKPSASENKDQIHVNCTRKRLFDASYFNDGEKQNFLSKNSNEIMDHNPISDINCVINTLSLFEGSKTNEQPIRNDYRKYDEPIENDYSYEKQIETINNDFRLQGHYEDIRSDEEFDNTNLGSTESNCRFEVQNSIKSDHRSEKQEQLVKRDPRLNKQATAFQNATESQFQNPNEIEPAIDKHIENGTTDSKFEKSEHVIRREFKIINSYNVESHLKKFQIRSGILEQRITKRIDELACCFTQIIEDILTDVILKNGTKITILSLHECLDYITEMYQDNNTIKLLCDKFYDILRSNTEKGAVKTSIQPNVFLRMIGCGVLLVKVLKSVVDCDLISDADENLVKLLESIEDPMDEMEPALFVQTPVLSRSDVVENTGNRRNFEKTPKMVEDYLKKHFTAWQAKEASPQQVTTEQKINQQTKVFRTFGNNLSQLKIDSKKNINISNNLTNLNPDSKIKKKLNEIKISFENSKENDISQKKSENKEKHSKKTEKNPKKTEEISETTENLTGAKLLKKLAFEPPKIPKMREIDVEKRECVNKDILNMIDCMVAGKKVITHYYDINSIIVKPKETENTLTSPTLPQSNTNVKRPSKIDRNVKTANVGKTENPKDSKKINGNKNNIDENGNNNNENRNRNNESRNNHFDSKNNNVNRNDNNNDDRNNYNETRNNNNEKKHKYDVNRNINDENSNNNNENRNKSNENNINEKFDLDLLDYSVMASDSSISLSEKTNELEIHEIHDLIIDDLQMSDSNENTSRSSRKKVTSTSNIGGQVETSPDNDNSTDNNNVNSAQNNGNTDDRNINNDKSSSDNNVVDSTQNNGRVDDTMHAFYLMKMFLARLSVTYNGIYEFIVSASNDKNENTSEDMKNSLQAKAVKTYSLLAGVIENLKKIVERESSEDSLLKGIQAKMGQQMLTDRRITRYKQVVAKCVEQAQILQECLRMLISSDCQMSPVDRDIRYSNIFADE